MVKLKNQCGGLNAFIVLCKIIKENPWEIPSLSKLTIKPKKFASASF